MMRIVRSTAPAKLGPITRCGWLVCAGMVVMLVTGGGLLASGGMRARECSQMNVPLDANDETEQVYHHCAGDAAKLIVGGAVAVAVGVALSCLMYCIVRGDVAFFRRPLPTRQPGDIELPSGRVCDVEEFSFEPGSIQHQQQEQRQQQQQQGASVLVQVQPAQPRFAFMAPDQQEIRPQQAYQSVPAAMPVIVTPAASSPAPSSAPQPCMFRRACAAFGNMVIAPAPMEQPQPVVPSPAASSSSNSPATSSASIMPLHEPTQSPQQLQPQAIDEVEPLELPEVIVRISLDDFDEAEYAQGTQE